MFFASVEMEGSDKIVASLCCPSLSLPVVVVAVIVLAAFIAFPGLFTVGNVGTYISLVWYSGGADPIRVWSDLILMFVDPFKLELVL